MAIFYGVKWWNQNNEFWTRVLHGCKWYEVETSPKNKKSSNDNGHHSFIISQNKTSQDQTDRILLPTPSLFPSRPKTGCFELDTTNYGWNTESPFRRKALRCRSFRKENISGYSTLMLSSFGALVMNTIDNVAWMPCTSVCSLIIIAPSPRLFTECIICFFP